MNKNMDFTFDALSSALSSIHLTSSCSFQPHLTIADLYQVHEHKYHLTHEDVRVHVTDIAIIVTDYKAAETLYEIPLNANISLLSDYILIERIDGTRLALHLTDTFMAAARLFECIESIQ